MNDFIRFVIIPFLMVIFIFFIINEYEEYKCNAYSNVTERKTAWVFMDDCYVENDNNEMLLKDEYLKSIIAKEGLNK